MIGKTRVKEGKNEGSEEMRENGGGLWIANFLGRKEESTRFDHTSIDEVREKATHHLDLLATT